MRSQKENVFVPLEVELECCHGRNSWKAAEMELAACRLGGHQCHPTDSAPQGKVCLVQTARQTLTVLSRTCLRDVI
jgi:hypothetical protein